MGRMLSSLLLAFVTCLPAYAQLTLRGEKGSPLTIAELDGNFSYLDQRLDGVVDQNAIRVTSTGNVTAALQAAVDAAGETVSIVFDTASCELYGLEISGKTTVRICATQRCQINYPSGTYDIRGQSNSDTMLYIEDCDTIVVDARLMTIDASNATFTRPTLSSETLRWCWYIKGSGDLISIRGLRNQNNGQPTLRIQNATVGQPGYDRIYLSEFWTHKAPGTISIRGQHDQIDIRKVWQEDPAGLGTWHVSAGIGCISVTSEVSVVSDHTQSVSIRDVYGRWGNPGVTVQQGCRHMVFDNIVSDQYGWTWDGVTRSNLDSNGGPVHKIDNVLWQPEDNGVPRYASITRLVTRNTNRTDAGRFQSLWLGQAGNQRLKYSDCSFDAWVNAPGAGTPTRPGSEGWARLGVISDTDFYSRVFTSDAKIVNCGFFAPTVVDPSVPTSQHDDFDQSFAGTPLLLLCRRSSVISDCDFYGAKIHFDSECNDLLFDNCRFHAGSYIEAGNQFSGTVEFNGCRNLDLRSATPTVTAGTKKFIVRDPRGSYSTALNGANGSFNPVEIELYEASEVTP